PRIEKFPTRDALPVFTIAAFQSSTLFQPGCACRTSAAVPATCGEACEVPEIVAPPFVVPLPAETMLTPGAVMSGFSELSPSAGPNELKLASCVNVGFAMLLFVSVAVLPSAPRATAASSSRMPRNGMVTFAGSAVSGLLVIGPSTGGKPGEVLIIATAAAPASWP